MLARLTGRMTLFVGTRIIYALSQWAMVGGLAKLSGPAEVGSYGVALALVTPIMTMAGLGLRQAAATDLKHEFPVEDYFTTRAVTTVVATLAIAGLGLALYGYSHLLLLSLLLVPGKYIEATAELRYGLLQREGKNIEIAVSMLLRSIVNIAVFLVVFYATRSLTMAIVANAFGLMLATWCYDQRLMRRIFGKLPTPRWATWREHARNVLRMMLRYGPLGASAFVVTSMYNLPRIFVEHYNGLEAAGYFTAFSLTFQAAAMMVQVAGASIITQIAKDLQQAKVRRLAVTIGAFVSIVSLGALGGTAILFLVREPTVRILFSPLFTPYAGLFVFMSLACIPRYAGEILRLPLSAARRYSVQMTIDSGLLAAALVVNWLLIARMGVVGGVWAMLVSNSALAILYAGATVIVVKTAKKTSDS